ncbi:single-stranded DNA-binding protein [Streptomyces sp. J2-1]|uniref:single-stranded DNA-binding protein n=1 Tax=Streptomyces corallincola TaxID=2851888 RepID=UPI001C38DA87|nr:single-stranded DNA-binding protein [Streptomyces corallincola]MBV2357490.1 single-stranded DNA-binding protein [Streptomyces corallincola]
MNETVVCVVGNVATPPAYRDLPTGPSARFRLAVTARYWDREKNLWTDGHTNFFTVWANRQLAGNVMGSVEVGQPVIVQGRLKVRAEQREGQPAWASADIDAVTIGHDLARGTALFRRTPRMDTVGIGGAAPGVAGASGVAGAVGAVGASDARPEPVWETPAAADVPDAPPGRPVAGVAREPVLG